jgi:hypothetical protein
MPSRSVRRKQHKRVARFEKPRSDLALPQTATELLLGWRAEARRRAARLGAPAVWALAASSSVQAIAGKVDPSGELLSELRRVCAEAVAEVAGYHLVGGSRPLADRRRLVKANKAKEEVVR